MRVAAINQRNAFVGVQAMGQSTRPDIESGRQETPPTADDIFESLREIITAGEQLIAGFHRRIPSMDGHGMAPFALRAIADAGRRGLSQVDLAKELHCSASSTTRLIDALEKAEIVQRASHPNDRRINMIGLTDTGHKLLDQLFSDLTGPASPLRDVSASDMKCFKSQLSTTVTIANSIL